MQSGWVRWIAYMLLAALVVVASCQAMAWPAGAAAAPPAFQAAAGARG